MQGINSSAPALGPTTDFFVGSDEAVKIVSANPRRRFIEIEAGDTDLWWGPETLTGGTVGRRIIAGGRTVVENKAEIYVIRNNGNSGIASYGEEF